MRSLTRVVDWAGENTVSTISCLAAHAAVLHLDGIARRPLPKKLFGVFEEEIAEEHKLTAGLSEVTAPHSRWNELRERDLAAKGYSVLTRSDEAGVGLFAKDNNSLFLFVQGHRNTRPRRCCANTATAAQTRSLFGSGLEGEHGAIHFSPRQPHRLARLGHNQLRKALLLLDQCGRHVFQNLAAFPARQRAVRRRLATAWFTAWRASARVATVTRPTSPWSQGERTSSASPSIHSLPHSRNPVCVPGRIFMVGAPQTKITTLLMVKRAAGVAADAGQHFTWLGGFLGLDAPASSTLTRELLGWQPTQPGLIADLEQGRCISSSTARRAATV